MHRILLLLALAACTQPDDQHAGLITDHCALTEYRQECDLTVGHEDNAATPEQLQACYAKAEREAMRIAAGVTPDCLLPGSGPKLW